MTTVQVDADRLDQLSAQVAEIAAELQRQRAERERWAELGHELIPVSKQALDTVTRELDELSADMTIEDMAALGREFARNVRTLQALLAQLSSVAELASEVTPLAEPAMQKLTESLAELERRGYFGFARNGLGIVDRVVTSFTEEDVQALGENIVLILQAVREMTQPEVMALVRRTMVTVREDESAYATPPSTFALLRQMRDPEVRRGLARVMDMLRTIGVQSAAPTQTTPSPER